MNNAQNFIENIFNYISHLNLYILPFAGLLFIGGYLWASWKSGVIRAKDNLVLTLKKEVECLHDANRRQEMDTAALLQENQRLQRINRIEQQNLQDQIISLRSYFPAIIAKFEDNLKRMDYIITKIDNDGRVLVTG